MQFQFHVIVFGPLGTMRFPFHAETRAVAWLEGFTRSMLAKGWTALVQPGRKPAQIEVTLLKRDLPMVIADLFSAAPPARFAQAPVVADDIRVN